MRLTSNNFAPWNPFKEFHYEAFQTNSIYINLYYVLMGNIEWTFNVMTKRQFRETMS